MITLNGTTGITTPTIAATSASTFTGALALPAGGLNVGSGQLAVDASGRVTMPYQPAFQAHKNTTTAAFTEIAYNQARLNTGNHFNTTNGRFTAPVAGRYMFSVFGVPNNTSLINLSIYKNGSAAGAWVNNGSTGQDTSCSMSFVMEMAAGDYASVFLVGGTMRQSNGDNNSFSGYLIG